MALTVTIEAVSRSFRAGTLEIIETLNGRASLRVDIVSLTGSYIPEVDDVITVTDGATEIFEGLIVDTTLTYLRLGAGVVTTVDAADYSAYAERRVIKASTGGGITGRDAIDFVVDNYLATYGVTRDSGMPAGATLGALSYDYARANEVLDDIVRLAAPTGWLWRIDQDKVLTAFLPSISNYGCPFSVTTADPNLVGDITVKEIRDQYANRVILVYGDGTNTPATVVSNNATEQSSRGIYEAAINTPGPLTQTAAQALADAYKTQMSAAPTQVVFTTREAGAHAGQTITINLASRNLNANYLITEVRMNDRDGKNVFYTITALEGATPTDTWKGTYRLWAGRGGVASGGGSGWGGQTPSTLVFSQDFESGSTLATLGAVDYSGATTNFGCANTTGQGLNGTTWGLLATAGSTGDYPEVGWNMGTPGFGSERSGWCEFFCNFSRLQEFGWTLVAAMNGNYSSAAVPVFDLYVGTESGDTKFWLYAGTTGTTEIATITNLITASTSTRVRCEWRQSTWSGGSPLSDGEFRLYINNILEWSLTGITLAQSAGSDAIQITRIYTNPCGRLDEIRIGYGAYRA